MSPERTGKQPLPQAPQEILSQPTEVRFGMYLPRNVLTNEEIASWEIKKPGGELLTSEGIFDAVGVRRRHIATPRETTDKMAFEAISDMVYRDKGSFQDPDMLFVSTSFPTGFNHAARVMDGWMIPNGTLHQDIHAACSGMVKGLVTIHKAGERLRGARVLGVATERYTPYVHDLREGLEGDTALSQTIFGDGAVAWEFIVGESLKILAAENYPMYEQAGHIGMPIDIDKIVGSADREVADHIPRTSKIEQNGRAVFKFMVRTVPSLVRNLAKEAGIETGEPIPTFLHQGSIRVIKALSEELQRPVEGDSNIFNVITDIEDGNFSSATIPRMLARYPLQKGQQAILFGFGAGLFASGAVVEFG